MTCSSTGTTSEAFQPIFDHNILYNGGNPFFGTSCTDVSAKYGNLVADPQFVDSANNDYRLKVSSPAIDSGNNSVLQSLLALTGSPLTQDYSGNPRLQDATGKGFSVIDMGAYEAAGEVDTSETTIVLTSSEYQGGAGYGNVLTATMASPLGVPSGNVDFILDAKNIGTASIGSDGVATLTNVLFTPGVHNIYATYSGSNSFTPATSVVVIVQMVVSTVQLDLNSSPNSSYVGQNVTFTLTETSDSSDFPGPVSLIDTSNNDTLLANLTPDSSGVATYSTSSLALGPHNIRANYAGDANHGAATSLDEQQVSADIGYPTNLNFFSSVNPSSVGQPVTFKVNTSSVDASYIPSPIVIADTNTGGTLTTLYPDAKGNATFTTSTLPKGFNNITATYGGDSLHTAQQAVVNQVVNGIASTAALTSSINPANVGQSVALIATITAPSGVPTGSVTFTDGTTALGTVALANNIATYATSTLSVGVHPIIATYNPASGSSFDSSSASLSQLISASLFPTSTIISNTPDQTNSGESVTIRVAVTSTDPAFVPASVTLSESYNGDPIAILTPDASGYASYTTTTLPGGYTFIYANYAGDATHAASSAYTEQYVSNTPVPTADLTSSLDPAGVGQPVTFTATIKLTDGTPAGVETFQDDQGNLLGTEPIVNGVASITTSKVALGAHTITANYIPTGSPYTDLEAILVQVIDGTTASTTATTLTSSLNPANVGQTVEFTASVSSAGGTTTGTITFTDGATTLGTQSLVNGVATYSTSTLAIGTHTITAAYSPTGPSFNASSATLSQVINGIATTTSLIVTPTSASYGSAISMMSSVASSGAALAEGGGVTFMDGGTAIATGEFLPGQSTTTFTDQSLAVGTHTITAVYSGDAMHNGSTSAPVTVTITAASTSLLLVSSSNPALALQPFAVAASFDNQVSTGVPGVTITFLVNGAVAGTGVTDPRGVASLILNLPAGKYTLTASYAGSNNLAAATSAAIAETDNPNPTTAALYAQPNPGYQNGNETLTANVLTEFSSITAPIIPTGTVTFFDAGSAIATSPLDAKGTATFSTAALSVGSHSVTAVYNGTPNFLPSTSKLYTLDIVARDFTLTVDPGEPSTPSASITIQTEHHKELAVTLTSLGGFADNLVLTCGNLPQYASCNFTHSSVALLANATLPVTIDIDTDALHNYAANPRQETDASTRSAVAFGLLLPVAFFARRRRGWASRILLALTGIAVAASFTGCSGHYPGHTSPGTYNISVTASGGATGVAHTASFTLVVTE